MKRIRRNVQLTLEEFEALTEYAKMKSASFSRTLVDAAMMERKRMIDYWSGQKGRNREK